MITRRDAALGFPDPPVTRVNWKRTSRLIPSRYPAVGLFDRVAAPEDLDAVIELEGWTNDRINAELGILSLVPRDEWVAGRPHATVVMAAFCHPRPGGSRFADEARGAWYSGRRLETAIAESVYHRTQELAEIGAFNARVQMRLYHADFHAPFHDLRRRTEYAPLFDPVHYTTSQQFARTLLDSGSNGVVYPSVRHDGGECIACLRPKLVLNVTVAAHYDYRWHGGPDPVVTRVRGSHRE
jgi:RES domain